jgi:hypothetical protein
MECGIAIYNKDDLKLLNSFSNFSIAEIPGEMLDADNAEDDFHPGFVFYVRELLGRNIISELPEAPFRVRREFLNLLEKRCEVMAQNGMPIATLTPDLGRAVTDKKYAETLRDILLCIAGIVSRYEIDIRFELRLPENFDRALQVTWDFLHSNTLFYKLLLDFHPHEHGSFDILGAAAEKFPFNRDSWRISFEVASCNYLSPAVVKRVMQISRPGGWEKDFMIFAPGKGTDSENYFSLDKLAGECCKKELTNE